MADIKTASTIRRTYQEYRDASAGWGTECYYGLVVQAFDQRPDETVDFEAFDDAFLKKLAGLHPDADLPLKSNEIFDSNYWIQIICWYYLPCDTPVNCSYLIIPQNFLNHVKEGFLEPYTDYYVRENVKL